MSQNPPDFQVIRRAPMSNAERQRIWRAKHRPTKRKMVHVPPGMEWTLGQGGPPPGFVASPPPIPQPAPPQLTAAAPEHNYCPHCGAAVRKRAKTPKLAA